MASVEFFDVLVTLDEDPSQTVAVMPASIAVTPAVQQRTQTFANGRIRQVTGPRRQRVAQIASEWITLADAATLEDWQGRIVWYRDPEQRRFPATMTVDRVSDIRANTGHTSIGLTFTEVTRSEAV